MSTVIEASIGNVIVPDEGRDWFDRRAYDLAAQGLEVPPMMGGAEIFPDEGLDYILNVFPRQAQALPSQLFLGLFTSQTASTVPADVATLGVTPSGVTEETSAGGYVRIAMANSNWPAPADSGTGRRTTVVAPGISFAESTGAYGAVINGFFVHTVLSGAGVALFYANFSDTTAITVNAAGFTIRIAPFWHLDA